MFMGIERPARKINRRPGNTDEGKPFLWDKMAHTTCHELVSFISLLSVKNVSSDFCAIIPSSPSLRYRGKVSFLYAAPGFIYVGEDSGRYLLNPGHCYLTKLGLHPMSI